MQSMSLTDTLCPMPLNIEVVIRSVGLCRMFHLREIMKNYACNENILVFRDKHFWQIR